jgi:hypothetical protein
LINRHCAGRDRDPIDLSPMPGNSRTQIGQAIGDRRYGKELEATARAWLVLAERIEQGERLEARVVQA